MDRQWVHAVDTAALKLFFCIGALEYELIILESPLNVVLIQMYYRILSLKFDILFKKKNF